MIPCQEVKSKRKIRVKISSKNQYVSNQSTEPYQYNIAKVILHVWAEKINTSLTQKDTVDRGAWIKKIQKEGMQEDSERTKSPKAQKCKMAWEWGTNEYFCLPYVTILWCPSWKLPEDRGKKWNSYSWTQKIYLDF